MNKGIVMEVNDIYSIVMNDGGTMEKISSKPGLAVGQKIFYFEEDIIKCDLKDSGQDSNSKDENINKNNVITLNDKRRKINNKFIKTFGSIAALFLIIFTFFMHNAAPEKAYAVVTLDINPSIQLEVNSSKKIISVEGVNDDGKALDLQEIKGLDIDEGINIIKQKLIENNYLDNNHDVLVAFAVVDEKDAKDNSYEEEILDTIKTTFKSENIAYVKGNKQAVAEAKSQGISLGRYEAALTGDDTIKNNIKDVPVKEITSVIKNKQNCVYIEAAETEPDTDTIDEQKDSSAAEQNVDSSKKPQNEAVKSEGNVNNQNSTEQVDNVKSPEQSASNEAIKTEGAVQEDTSGTADGDKNTRGEDEGILEVAPEIQTPNHQVEVPSQSADTKPENIIVDPEKDKLENSKPSNKIEDEEKEKETEDNTVLEVESEKNIQIK